jgi:hypothetical protein
VEGALSDLHAARIGRRRHELNGRPRAAVQPRAGRAEMAGEGEQR